MSDAAVPTKPLEPSLVVTEIGFGLHDMERCADAPSDNLSILPFSGTLISVGERITSDRQGDPDAAEIRFVVLQDLPIQKGKEIRFRAVREGIPFGGALHLSRRYLRFVGTVYGIHIFASEPPALFPW